MAIRNVTIRVDAVNGQPGLATCGCSGDGTGSRLVLIPRDPTIVADGSGVLKGTIVGVPNSYKSATTGRLKYTLYQVEYNDALLTDPSTPLAGCDLLYSCCEGCEITYIDRKLAHFCGNISLTESAGGVLVFKGCEGAPVDFQLGVKELSYATSGCEGVGADYAIKAASISGDILTLAGAALQDANFSAAAAGEGSLALNISNSGTYARNGDGIQLDVTIPPLSLCNDMVVMYALDMAFAYDVANNWAGLFQVMGKKDADAFGLFETTDLVAYSRRTEYEAFTGHGLHIIPAGNPVSFSFYPQILTTNTSATSTWRAWSMGFRALVVNRKA